MSNNKDSLGDRMKRYEYVSRTYLTRRTPVIIRIDGKAFHTFTKGMRKPFDKVLMNVMQETMKSLCENIQGCVFGYTQSDEITLVLTDYEAITTEAWFGNNVQKMVSVSASMATQYFNKYFKREYSRYCGENLDAPVTEGEREYRETLYIKFDKALFDSRVFILPKEEVCNCLIWRQQDATRNSIEAVGQAYFSHKERHKKTCNQIQDMLWKERKINWNDYPVDCKRGSCCVRKEFTEEQYPKDFLENPDAESTYIVRKRWVIDKEPPIFTQDREYVERWL